MKKNIYFSISFLLILIITLTVANKGKYINYDENTKIALNVDGSTSNSIPPKGHYVVSVNCGNTGDGKWDYDTWKLFVHNASDNIKCDVNFNSFTLLDRKFNEKIRLLAVSSSTISDWINSGAVIEEHGFTTSTEYRYEGKNVNNYVLFNNELWRIIGVFDEASHGIAGKNLVKIMRANSIGGISWDSRDTDGNTYDSNWAEASLNILLNEYYYQRRNNDDLLGNVSTYCHGSNTVALGSCNFSNIGINSIYRNMVEENAKWYLKGTNDYITPKEYFNCERNGKKKSADFPDYVEKPVGLMYISDYGYSTGSTCANIKLNSYNNGCATKSWIYGNSAETTISHFSSTMRYSYIINYDGNTIYSNVGDGNAVRPTLYLKENTFIYDGDGSYNNPYIIGIDE